MMRVPILHTLTMLSVFYHKQAEALPEGEGKKLKGDIVKLTDDLHALLEGTGVHYALENHDYTIYTLTHALTLGDRLLYTKLRTILNALESTLNRTVPTILEMEGGAIILQQSPQGKLLGFRFWEGITVQYHSQLVPQ